MKAAVARYILFFVRVNNNEEDVLAAPTTFPLPSEELTKVLFNSNPKLKPDPASTIKLAPNFRLGE